MIDVPTVTHRRCDGIPRREYLRIGALSLFGLNLPQLLRAAESQTDRTASARKVSCILMWLSGGISQIDSFDPKPNAPSEIRGEFGTIPTRTPGIHFVEHLPKLAKMTAR